LEEIKEKPSPSLPANGNFSAEAIDFIGRCLKKRPEERDTAIGLLAHPWILKYSMGEANLPGYFGYLK